MKKISDIFEAHPKSAADFMRERGQGFYIPAYQRQFSWDKANIERLFDDVGHGINQLLHRDDATTFIGTLITIHDTEYTTVDPIVRGQVPGKVMTVIDGQQRLTTLLLVNLALHNELTTRHTKFNNKTDQGQIWIYRQCVQTLSELIDTLQEDMSHGDGNFRWYPRMIRAYQDKWSRYVGEAQYDSEISDLLHSYGAHTREDPNRVFKPETENIVSNRLDIIRKTLRKAIARGDHDEIEFPGLSELSKSKDLSLTLFNHELPNEVVETLEDEQKRSFNELYRLLVFARFVLHRVAVTVVIARSEDYAFDMFESLNTTGEPLTAFETFVPHVIREVGHSEYQSSNAKRYMDHVETYLDNFKTAHNRQQATNDLLVPFALAESGDKLSKRLNDQRRYLKDQYDRLESDDKHEFIRHMAHTALLLQGTWNSAVQQESGPALDGVEALDTQEKMCFDVLHKAKHSIAIAPLARFYSAKRDGHDVSIGDAVRAVTAFFALWRGAKGSTGRIEDRYRSLLARGSEGNGVPPLARRSRVREVFAVPDAELLKTYFRAQLKEQNIHTREAWVQEAKDVPVYNLSKPLTRLLLLAATHNTVTDPENPGLVKRARSGVLNLLTFEHWADDTKISVEHIAPQKREESSDWRDSLYAQSELKDCLGNLLLLPSASNASISNRSWVHKRAIYRVLSAESPDDVEEARDAARRIDVEIPPEILEMNEYLPITAGVATYPSDWDIDIVNRRSEVLLGIAWDRLAPWLGY